MRITDHNRPELTKETARICLWVIRDTERLRKQAELASMIPECGEVVIYHEERMSFVRPASVRRAAEIVGSVDRALAAVPEEYRQGIIDNIVHRKEFGCEAHINTWKKWKSVLLSELAYNLNLI